jgi:release factor glutamine methyltransferase
MPALVRDVLRTAIARLAAAGVPGAARDARLCLAAALGIADDRLTLHLGDALGAGPEAAFARMIAAREARQPVSQILGKRLFWGRYFKVTGDVLDPRPETETLVAATLEQPFDAVLDLGTGSGCLLLTLLAERPAARGVGVDLSEPALAVARANAAALGVTARVRLVQGDWAAGLEGRFDLIVSNPPYIPAAEMAALAPEVRDWEPALALSPGADGLAAYRAIASAAPRLLAPGGALMVEHGAGQGAGVAAILAGAGATTVAAHADMDGRARVVAAHWA